MNTKRRSPPPTSDRPRNFQRKRITRRDRFAMLAAYEKGLARGERSADLISELSGRYMRSERQIQRYVALARQEEIKKDKDSGILTPWVVQAQQAHLEGIERQEVWKGVETITYRQPGIRQLLQGFKDCFLDIYPEKDLFWRPKYDESVMTQLRSHLPDGGFWNKVRDFKGKATECETLLNAAYQSFTSAGEEVAPLRADDCPDSHITSSWAHQVVYQALALSLGLVSWGYGLGETELSCGKLIYRGADVSNAVEKHRRLVEDFRKTQEFSLIVGLMKDLQNLRQQIFARINQCLHDNEYVLHYCSSCPAEKARRSQPLL